MLRLWWIKESRQILVCCVHLLSGFPASGWGFDSLALRENIKGGGPVGRGRSLENCWAIMLRGFDSLRLRNKGFHPDGYRELVTLIGT